MYGDKFGEDVSGNRGLKGQLVRFLLVREDLEGIRVTGYLTLSKLVLSPAYFINLSFNTENKKLWCYVPIKGYNFKEAYTRHTGNYIICNFIYSFTYLFNHFQQKTRLEFKCVLANNLPSP